QRRGNHHDVAIHFPGGKDRVGHRMADADPGRAAAQELAQRQCGSRVAHVLDEIDYRHGVLEARGHRPPVEPTDEQHDRVHRIPDGVDPVGHPHPRVRLVGQRAVGQVDARIEPERERMVEVVPDLAVAAGLAAELPMEQDPARLHLPALSTWMAIGTGNNPVNSSRPSSTTSKDSHPSWRDSTVVRSTDGASTTRVRMRYTPCWKLASKPMRNDTGPAPAGSAMRRPVSCSPRPSSTSKMMRGCAMSSRRRTVMRTSIAPPCRMDTWRTPLRLASVTHASSRP